MTDKPNTDPNKTDLSRQVRSYRQAWQLPPRPEWIRRDLLKQLWRYRTHDHYTFKGEYREQR